MKTTSLLALTMLASLAACRSNDPMAPAVSKAVAVIQPTTGNEVYGIVSFEQVSGGVRVVGDIHKLSPGRHGFHVHDFGDASAPDGTSAGGHFNPQGHVHATPDSPVRHVGDLGNLSADSRGYARYDRVDPGISLGGPHSIIGRAVIIHADEDDFGQPTGNAGARVGIGVIGIGKDM